MHIFISSGWRLPGIFCSVKTFCVWISSFPRGNPSADTVVDLMLLVCFVQSVDVEIIPIAALDFLSSISHPLEFQLLDATPYYMKKEGGYSFAAKVF